MNKKSFKIAIAQINSNYNNIKNNIEKHIFCIVEAAKNDADLILFPELSLTSYNRNFTNEYVFDHDDIRFENLKKISHERNIIIVFGVPIRKESKIYIASVVQFPNGNRKVYCKNNLHEGEEVFFDEGEHSILINVGLEKIALGICYDIEIQHHIENAAKSNATIYASSIFYSEDGIEGLQNKVKSYVDQFRIDIAISNFVGEVWGIKSGGGSMYWTKNGECVGKCSKFKESILFCTKKDENWKTETINI